MLLLSVRASGWKVSGPKGCPKQGCNKRGGYILDSMIPEGSWHVLLVKHLPKPSTVLVFQA